MNCLLINGAIDTGKSRAIIALRERLLALEGFTEEEREEINNPSNDIRVIINGINIQGNKIRIIINSETDTEFNIIKFKKFYDSKGSFDIFISSVRDIGYLENLIFFNTFGDIIDKADFLIQIPLARIESRRNLESFNSSITDYFLLIDNLINHILNRNPFNINII